MACTERQERELVMKMKNLIRRVSDLEPLEHLRAHVLGKGVRGLKTLARRFKVIDKNKDGRINLDEFRQALQIEGLLLEAVVETRCFEQIDTDHSGYINFDEFIYALRPVMPACRRALVQRAFAKLDANFDGVITVDDLKGVYNGRKHPKYLNGMWTEAEVFQEWLNYFNGPDNLCGEVTRCEFENYYAGVSASVDSNVYFDLMMRQAWRL